MAQEAKVEESNENVNFLVRALRRIRNYLNPTEANEDIVTEKTERNRQQFSAELQKIGNTGTAVEIKSFLLLYFDVLGVFFEERGRKDGKLEIIPQLAFDFISSEAKELQGLITGIFISKESVADTDNQARNSAFETASDDLKAQKTYVEAIEKKYRYEYKDFAIFIGVLYLLFSVGFLMADFPLSRLIVLQGFEINSTFESWLLTIGITLIGVYFKIWWDEYINPAVEKVITKSKPWNLDGFDQITGQELEVGLRTVRRSRIWRGILKTTILIAALASIGILGYFRYIVYLYTEFTLTSKPIPSTLDSFWAIAGFISIAILFPFLGGICLSIGTDKIQNWRERHKSRIELKKKEKEYLLALKAKEDADKELSVSTEYLSWCLDGQFIKDCQDLFLSRYNRGYGIGFTESNLEMDVMTKAENIRKRMIGKNAFTNTQPIISEDYFRRIEQTN